MKGKKLYQKSRLNSKVLEKVDLDKKINSLEEKQE